MIKEAVWHQDGHVLHLELRQAELYVTFVDCPRTGSCIHEDAACVVEFFINQYGLEVNIGTCPPEPELEIAWTLLKDGRRELEAQQLWITPVNDYIYSAFRDSQMPSQ